MSEAAKTYRLGSAPMVHAPGLVAWAINGYAHKADRATMETIISDSWSIPIGPTRALLSKAVPYTVDGDAVVFAFNPLTDYDKIRAN
jgi:hypothetical protein